MKAEIFYWVLNAGIHGALVCLLVWALRAIRPLPRRAVFLLWLGPLFRLTLPFGLSLPWSVMSLLKQLGGRSVALPGIKLKGIQFWAVNSVQAAEQNFPLVYKTDRLEKLFETCALIWVVGAAACALTMITLYGMTLRELRGAKRLRGRIWVSEKVVSPGLFGVLRPRILVPPGMEGRLLELVEIHEEAHRRRLDNLWRLLALGVCCLHWFNPVVWYSLKLFFTDMELACDEAVLRRLGEGERKDYALALLSAAKGRDLFVSAFGGAKLRLRMERVLSYKRLSLGAGLVFGLLGAAVISSLVFG